MMNARPTQAGDKGEGPRQVAERLRGARKYLGLSQQYVAEHTGIPRVAIPAIENGKGRSMNLN